MSPNEHQRIENLPDVLAVFPLPGALLFPRWQLPLNIFEPRYLNMTDDAMAGTRLIGMIQSMGGSRAEPALARVGCAGRITAYSETDDGRYLITLTGVARFEVAEELSVTTPYRQVRADWTRFQGDLQLEARVCVDTRQSVISALQAYVERNGMSADWETVESAPMETLINALCSGCPFSTAEKQALVEAATLNDRAKTLISLLKMDVPGGDAGSVQ